MLFKNNVYFLFILSGMKKGEIEKNKVETLYWHCCLKQEPVWRQEIKQQQTLYFQISESSKDDER